MYMENTFKAAIEFEFYAEKERNKKMEDTIILVGLLGLCVGMFIGMIISFFINHTYILDMNKITEKHFDRSNEITSEYVTKMLEHENKFFNDAVTRLAKALDELNKSYEVPTWNHVSEKLPECEGLYYGKIDDTNSMWKVNYIKGKWMLAGYPEHEMKIISWTEIY
jgi:uncharacterized membrane-anchored protein YhcB (DUF1043 family)